MYLLMERREQKVINMNCVSVCSISMLLIFSAAVYSSGEHLMITSDLLLVIYLHLSTALLL